MSGKPLPLCAELNGELMFHQTRRWSFDFAWPDVMIAVEIDGGRWKPGGGRHGGDGDKEKLNEAAALGWRVLRFSPAQIKNDAAQCVDVVLRAMSF